MTFDTRAKYVVTDARVAPHYFAPGTAVRYTGQDNGKPGMPAHRWVFRGLSASGRSMIQWLADDDVEVAP